MNRPSKSPSSAAWRCVQRLVRRLSEWALRDERRLQQNVNEDAQALVDALLRGERAEGWRSSMYYHYYESGEPHTVAAHYGVRTERYKLIRFYGAVEAWELYDLQEDPDEMRNLAGDAAWAGVMAEMQGELARLRAYYKDSEPGEVAGE